MTSVSQPQHPKLIASGCDIPKANFRYSRLNALLLRYSVIEPQISRFLVMGD
ncbi:hypothetical protein MFFC18_07350 [Mariniblastus fucicola]|uniref:Uncharacterized protein n=1 Tax=Mariniblastus fucicola TaxID=980251 RepID=A0A5B9P3U9_9BACT|nr:hypothetical protein MFFC18_07350 [Mariniblastus fucicola]